MNLCILTSGMYRYSQKKTELVNQKLRAKQRARSQARARRPTAVLKRNNRVRHSGKTTVKTQSRVVKTVTKERKSRSTDNFFSQFGSSLMMIWSSVLVVILSLGCYLIVMNTILPHFFHLERSKTVLLVGSRMDTQAKLLYLVRIEPAIKTVQVTDLSWEMLVPVVGGQDHGLNPLGSVAPILKNYDHASSQWVKAAYIFALGRGIDEVRFLPDLTTITTKKDLQSQWQALLGDRLARTTKVDRELIDEYFQLRSSKYFVWEKVREKDQLTSQTQLLDRQKLVNCPVVLVNAAQVNGLARAFEQLIAGYGAAVINLSTARESAERSIIYYDEQQPDCQTLVQIATDTLPLTPQLIPDGGVRARQDRAEAVIILGQELSD